MLAAAPPALAAPGPCEIFADAVRTGFEADADLPRVYERLSAGPDWKVGAVTVRARPAGRQRPVEIAGQRFAAHFDVLDDETRAVRLRPSHASKSKACRVRLSGERAGRIEDMRPADAPAEFARRMPMGVLEPALGSLARALVAGEAVDAARLLGEGAEMPAPGTFVFSAGGGRFAAAIVPVEGREDAVQVSLSRLVPELGNRERPLGAFRFVHGLRLKAVSAE
jgi:hypothetical protein